MCAVFISTGETVTFHLFRTRLFLNSLIALFSHQMHFVDLELNVKIYFCLLQKESRANGFDNRVAVMVMGI